VEKAVKLAWNQHDDYQQALEQLLRDLQAT